VKVRQPPHRGSALRIRPGPVPLHRLPPLRVRMHPGEQPVRDPQIQWIQVLQLNKERGVDLEEAELYYNPAKVPEKGHFYMPVQCQQCERPPCVKVCPVQATWKERDGITVVDYNWCIAAGTAWLRARTARATSTGRRRASPRRR